MNCKKIKILGIGGTGINVLELTFRNGVQGAEYIAVDTDAETLEHSSASIQLQLGDQGTGSTLNPEYACKLAENATPEIAQVLQDADTVIIAAGFGKGTGTGAFPTIAKAAKLTGASVVGIIGMPFSYEGARCSQTATQALEDVLDLTNSLFVFSNELVEAVFEDDTLVDWLDRSNAVLSTAIIISIIFKGASAEDQLASDMLEEMKGHYRILAARSCHDIANEPLQLVARRATPLKFFKKVDTSKIDKIFVAIESSKDLSEKDVNEIIATIREAASLEVKTLYHLVNGADAINGIRISVLAVAEIASDVGPSGSGIKVSMKSIDDHVHLDDSMTPPATKKKA